MSAAVLWVTSEPPDRAGGGGSIRQSYLLEAVARHMTVDVLAVGGGLDEHCAGLVRSVQELAQPTLRARPRFVPGSVQALWETEVLRMTPAVADTRRHRRLLGPCLRSRASRYDVVHLEHDRLAPLAPLVAGPRRTITLHNLRSEQAAQRLAHESAWARRWLARRGHRVAQAFELGVRAEFDTVFVTSSEDAAALDGRCLVVPNGVDVAAVRPTPLPREPRIVFVGRLDWQPNVEGLQWFCRMVLPRVRSLEPQARFDIVGFNPVDEVLALRETGVQVHPDVPTTQPFLQAARIAVVPLHIGSGTRLKALEAMAAGRPTVGTAVGLAGLGLDSGSTVEIADDPWQMAAAIVRLLNDDEAAASLAAAGRRHVEAHFDWRRIGNDFAQAMAALATGASSDA